MRSSAERRPAHFRPAEPVWFRPEDGASRSQLSRHDACDVVVVGGGFTGLWTALHLSETAPALSVMVLDAVAPGHGASGRNGGWCTSELPLGIADLADLHGPDRAAALQRAMFATVSEIGARVRSLGIDCGWADGGWLTAATSPAQVPRVRAMAAEWAVHGFGPDDFALLDAESASAHVGARGTLAGLFTPHCAVLDPGRLVSGLVAALSDRGVRLCGGAVVDRYGPGRVSGHDEEGPFVVEAGWVVRATEAYTAALAGHRRELLPIWSQMVATEPLGEDAWRSIGWAGRAAFNDARNMIIYAQRTVDGRIAFGGRGVGYRFGSGLTPSASAQERTVRRIVTTMHQLFPATRDARITHRWGGVLGVPRDWHPAVVADRGSRMVTAGGYTGNGVAASHLAGRIVAEIVSGEESPLCALPMVGHRSRPWEPEPLRWLGLRGSSRLVETADAIEARTGRPARRLLAVIDRLLG